ncbi:MAG: MBL fold metallo-hydrolase [Cyanobacteria bacterium P01_A01_bin.135]
MPRPVLNDVLCFAPNRETLGGTAYLVLGTAVGNLLIDCPALTDENQSFLQEQGLDAIVITHRDGLGQVRRFQAQFGCPLIIQEQEAYKLPNLASVTFQHQHQIRDDAELIWTPGYSPGSACLYLKREGGILFTGRHLLPDASGRPKPLRLAKTFHWYRQLNSVAKLRDRFCPQTLSYLCPGANTGFLRGERVVKDAYRHLQALDLDQERSRAVPL